MWTRHQGDMLWTASKRKLNLDELCSAPACSHASAEPLAAFSPSKVSSFFFFFFKNRKKMPKSCLHPSRMSQDNKPVLFFFACFLFFSPPFINETRWFLPEEVFTHPLPNTAFLCVCSHLTVFVWRKADGPQRWDLLFQCKNCWINSSGTNLWRASARVNSMLYATGLTRLNSFSLLRETIQNI